LNSCSFYDDRKEGVAGQPNPEAVFWRAAGPLAEAVTPMTQQSPGPMSAPPFVSVIVPHFRDLVGLDLCLTALVRQSYPRDCFEIVVADNASPEGEDAVASVVDNRARLTIVRERGAGAARNGGARLARGDIFAFTDSDCQPEADWLSEGVKGLAQSDFVGGRVKVLIRDPAAPTATEAFEALFAFDNRAYVHRKGFTVTASLFCARVLFEQMGGFVAAGVSEDVEWCHRARAAGYRIGYAPNSVVGHPARRTRPELLMKWRRIDAETFGLAMRRRSGAAIWLLRSLAMPFSAVAHTPKALFATRSLTPGQRLLAVGELFRLRFWRLGNRLSLLIASRR